MWFCVSTILSTFFSSPSSFLPPSLALFFWRGASPKVDPPNGRNHVMVFIGEKKKKPVRDSMERKRGSSQWVHNDLAATLGLSHQELRAETLLPSTAVCAHMDAALVAALYRHHAAIVDGELGDPAESSESSESSESRREPWLRALLVAHSVLSDDAQRRAYLEHDGHLPPDVARSLARAFERRLQRYAATAAAAGVAAGDRASLGTTRRPTHSATATLAELVARRTLLASPLVLALAPNPASPTLATLQSAGNNKEEREPPCARCGGEGWALAYRPRRPHSHHATLETQYEPCNLCGRSEDAVPEERSRSVEERGRREPVRLRLRPEMRDGQVVEAEGAWVKLRVLPHPVYRLERGQPAPRATLWLSLYESVHGFAPRRLPLLRCADDRDRDGQMQVEADGTSVYRDGSVYRLEGVAPGNGGPVLLELRVVLPATRNAFVPPTKADEPTRPALFRFVLTSSLLSHGT